MFGTIHKVIAVMAIACSATALAHHSFSAEYNITSPVTLKGGITAVEWINPHVHLTLAVRDAGGDVQAWQLEGAAPSALREMGWTPEILGEMVKSHAVVTVQGYRSRHAEERSAWAKDIELSDGEKLSFN